MTESKFKKQLYEFGIIKEEVTNKMNTKELYIKYKEYDKYVNNSYKNLKQKKLEAKKNLNINAVEKYFILAEVKIGENDIDKEIQIINSFENAKGLK